MTCGVVDAARTSSLDCVLWNRTYVCTLSGRSLDLSIRDLGHLCHGGGGRHSDCEDS